MTKRLAIVGAAIAATALVSVAGAASANAGVPMLTAYPSPAACQSALVAYQRATGQPASCAEGWIPEQGTVWWLVTY